MSGPAASTGPPAGWSDELSVLLAGPGMPPGAADLADRLPDGYAGRTTPAEAAEDLAALAGLGDPSATGARLMVRDRLPDAEPGSFRLRRIAHRHAELSAFLPVLESFGLVAVDVVALRLTDPDGRPGAHVDDYGVRPVGAGDAPVVVDPAVDGPRLVAAFAAASAGWCDVDPLNRLVTLAGLAWEEVAVLRAYRRYRAQSGAAPDGLLLDDALAAHPAVARALVDLFTTAFDPATAGDPDAVTRARASAAAALDLVPDLDEDRVLRDLLGLIDATLRTSYFREDGLRRAAADGTGPTTLALKLDSTTVPGLPSPRPHVETWVHGPTVEGVHLRAGPVARGGIRWSDRPGDLRTEVLGLAMAQVKKNAIIVPTGAKGGFVCRTGAPSSADDVRAAYEAFIAALLSVTDDLKGGEVVTPAGVVARDGPDPYLVVAADKGTATFSDLANALAESRGFWLGDAFASGGSRGYDHKAMGITARGAWVAVRRHFHQLDVDVQVEPIRVAGVGDMSGDVFGNGMLCSRAVRLVAAFDHRHVFVDPDPDPEASYRERQRLAALPRSSWDEYDRSVLSPGGGVWPRSAKRIELPEASRRVLGIEAADLSPPELIAAVLAAPVDLLWFGGIGTYVRGPDETDDQVGDHANDAVRISADQVRARVVAEGGNLGVTQAARIRYSRRGGRINADFIDNAAGVATSDREVNLKILLALAVGDGRLDDAGRDALLASATDEVAAAVLRQVDHGVEALNRAVPASAVELDAYEALLDELEAAGRVDRAVEDLPDAAEFAVRRAAGAGLIRPELASLLAYAKSHLVEALLGSSVVDDPSLRPAVEEYFPPAVRDHLADLVPRHRLYRELAATDLAGEVVEQMGTTWATETAAELGRPPAEVAAAYWAARQVLGAGDLWAELEAAAGGLSAEAEHRLHQLVRDAVGALARTYLRREGPVRPGEVADHDRPLADAIAAGGADHLPAPGREVEERLVALGVDPALADRFVGRAVLAYLSDASEVARTADRTLADVLAVQSGIDRCSGADRLAWSIGRIEVPRRWAAWQARALLDDVAAWRRAAALEALAAAPGAGPEVAVTAWSARHAAALAALAGLQSRLDPHADEALTLAGLVVRRLPREG